MIEFMSPAGIEEAGVTAAWLSGLKNFMLFRFQLPNADCAGVDTCKSLDGVLKLPILLDGVLEPRLLDGVLEPRLLDGVLKLPRLLDGVLEPRLLDGVLKPDRAEPNDGEPSPDRDVGMLKAPEADTISPATSRTISMTITRFISLPSTHCSVEMSDIYR
jgi:hypothetical protein